MGNKTWTAVSTPESVGISSRAVLRLVEQMQADSLAMHGFLILRDSKCVTEAYWPGFHPGQLHRIYSAGKSVVGLAVGCLADEGRIGLEDPIVRYFPERVQGPVHPYLARTTIRDLLVMATAQPPDAYTALDPNWVQTFFAAGPSHPPGVVFGYSTAATNVLTALVEKQSGVPLLEYLRPRILDPIGFSKSAWCIQMPEGISWGGSGILCSLRDLACLAQLCANAGDWHQRQLISRDFVDRATTRQIDTHHCPAGRHGYGYQIWIEPDHGFSFRGKGGQLALAWPGRRFIFACIADTQATLAGGSWQIMNALRQTVFRDLSDAPLEADPEGVTRLRRAIATLKWPTRPGKLASDLVLDLEGVWYDLDPNPMGLVCMRLAFSPGAVTWHYTNGQGRKQLTFGLGRYISGRFPQTGYFRTRIGLASDRQYACQANAAWAEPHTLNACVYLTDCFLGSLWITFAFRGSELTVYMQKHAEFILDEYQGFAVGRRRET